MKLLIGYDASEPAETAVRELSRAGLPPDVEATVLSVADLPTETPYFAVDPTAGAAAALPPVVALAVRESAARVITEAQQAAQKAAEVVRSLFPNWKVRSESAVDSPAWAIVHRAHELSVDLIVVGSHGRSGPERMLLGGVSQHVLRHAPCSVRIGRGEVGATVPREAGPIRIVLGVDGSHYSALAVSAVTARKWPPGTQVHVVAALDLRFWAVMASAGAPGWQVGLGEYDEHTWARKAVESVARELTDAGLLATAAVVEGVPKHVLVNEAATWSADCIFVGAKGHSRLERLLIGSVSSAVAARAPCSVEVVRQG